VRFAVLCAHGAYLRACGDGALRADGDAPSDPACVFVFQHVGAARELQTREMMSLTLRAANGCCVRWGEEHVSLGVPAHAVPVVAEIWSCTPSLTGERFTFSTRNGACFSAAATGEVRVRQVSGPEERFWLLDPATEQRRVDAYRRQMAAMTASAPAASGYSAQAADGLRQLVCAACKRADVGELLALCRANKAALPAVFSQQDGDGVTPLHHAAAAGYVPCTAALLEWGAQPTVLDRYGDTPLHVAAAHGSAEVAQLLLARGASVSARNADGWAPLHCAASGGSARVVKMLLAHSANPGVQDGDGETALHHAARLGRTAAAKALLENADVPARVLLACMSTDGFLPLHLAAIEGHCEVAHLLITHGAPVDACASASSNSWTALHCAACHGNEGMVQLLRSNGANVRAAGRKGELPVDLASSAAVGELLRSDDVAPRARTAPVATADALAAALAAAMAGAQLGGAAGKKQGAPAAAAPAQPRQAAPAHRAPAPPPAPPSKQHGKAAAQPARHAAPEQEPPRKLRMCRNWETGTCRYGGSCTFAHGDAELAAARRRAAKSAAAPMAASPAGPATKPAKPAAVAGAFAPMPFPQYGAVPMAQFDGHAEKLAAAFLRWLGFADAAVVNGVHTPDRGIDVRSSGALAQVKANFRAASISRQPLAQLFGDAAAHAPGKKPQLLFFAASDYSGDASSYAEQVGIRLFRLSVAGAVTPSNASAAALTRARTPHATGSTGASGSGCGKPGGAMARWSREDVQAWLHLNGLEAYAEAFKPIAGAVLLALTDKDLQELGVAIAVHRRTFLAAIAADSQRRA
jgi:ankyrin repeat protein